MEVPFYPCDPEKNIDCAKTSCFINGGPCTQTTKRECAVEEKEHED